MNIPGELIDSILGYLRSSPGALLNCTIVERSWTHIARAHLLHKLSFCLIRHNTPSHLTALAECISTDPILAQRVSILELRGTRPSEYIYPQKQDTIIPDDYLLLTSLLAKMTCVRELRLIALDWGALPQIISSAILALLSGHMVSTLHFEYLRLNSFSGFVRLISSTKSLRTLRLIRVHVFPRIHAFQVSSSNNTVEASESLSASRRGPGVVLHSLELDTNLDFHLLNTFFCAENTLDFSALRKLCLVHAYHPSALKELVNVVGPSIEELILSVKTISEPPVAFDLSLASLPKLLYLEFTDGITQDILESLFGSLKGPHPLREIVVHEDWVTHSLKAAQAYYLQPAFEALMRVEYRIMDSNIWKQVRYVYEETFSILREKGVFFLVQEEPNATQPRWCLPRYACIR